MHVPKTCNKNHDRSFNCRILFSVCLEQMSILSVSPLTFDNISVQFYCIRLEIPQVMCYDFCSVQSIKTETV